MPDTYSSGMNARITAQELFEQLKQRLELRWIAGQRGEKRALEPGANLSRRPSMAGYLNTIYPNKVQILGTEELHYLDALDSRQRWETLAKITAAKRFV
jgi:HPr kinase/phosphorylase